MNQELKQPGSPSRAPSVGDAAQASGVEMSGGWVDTRLPVYAETQRRIGYGDICLRRDGDYAVVEIEHEGRVIEVIREHMDGNFSNWITCLGIEDAILGREEFAPTPGRIGRYGPRQASGVGTP